MALGWGPLTQKWVIPPTWDEEQPCDDHSLHKPEIKDVMQHLINAGGRRAEHHCFQHGVQSSQGLQGQQRVMAVILLFLPTLED